MRVIVAGAGRIGYSIAEELAFEGHNLTVIDRDADNCRNISESLDVSVVNGNAASCEVLEDAGAQGTDLLIAVTQADETNLIICLTAKKMGVKHTIARVRSHDYYGQLSLLKNELGLSMTINPEEATAGEISRILRFPSAQKVEPFAKGRAESVEFRIPAQSALCGLKISDFSSTFREHVLICAVQRGQEVTIPRGDFVLAAGDRLNVVGSYRQISSFLKKVCGNMREIRSVIVLGGGMTCHYLVGSLINAGISVKIIERSEERCSELKNEFPKAQMVLADGRESNVLLEEGLENADAFITITGDDDDNVITSLYALSMGVKKVVTQIKETHIIRLLENNGLDTIFQPCAVATQYIVQYVRSMQNAYDNNKMESLYHTFEGKVEIMEFRITSNFEAIGIPLKKLKIDREALIAAIIRDGNCIIPSGDDAIRSGDGVIVATTQNGVIGLDDLLEA